MNSCQQETLAHDNFLVVLEGQVAQELDDLVPRQRQEVQEDETGREAAESIPAPKKSDNVVLVRLGHVKLG